jgi:phage terminase Nu1 subunit (DNA packaging protein)
VKKKSRGQKTKLLTRPQLARLLNYGPRHIQKLQEEGLPVAVLGRGGRPSQYDEKQVRKWLAEHQQGKQPEATPGKLNVFEERARKDRAQAQLAEQAFLIRQRELLPAKEVEKAWGLEVAAVRSVILASYTSHADRVLRAATLRGIDGVEQTLKDIAHEVLRELANPDRDLEAATS